jgi:hypothetical protein
LAQPFRTETEQEGALRDVFDPFAAPSGGDRYLREADNWSRRFASVRQAVPEDILEFMAGGLFGDLGRSWIGTVNADHFDQADDAIGGVPQAGEGAQQPKSQSR